MCFTLRYLLAIASSSRWIAEFFTFFGILVPSNFPMQEKRLKDPPRLPEKL